MVKASDALDSGGRQAVLLITLGIEDQDSNLVQLDYRPGVASGAILWSFRLGRRTRPVATPTAPRLA
jgi:hypothetical protein